MIAMVQTNGEQMSLLGEIHFLPYFLTIFLPKYGLTFYKKLTFILHFSKSYKKATYSHKVQNGQGNVGLSSEIVRAIYDLVKQPIVLYASCACAPAIRKLGVQKMLNIIQRSVLFEAYRAHSIVSIHSALLF
ncbi:hypothetical protein EVAR_14279_1 [Eumeta japonica]|uniref:Uncharacterized protein n=1 Tax=Eumeta variegata TaxID=151549 RepID=A0A4C1ULZ5_EUMVA|nr:hypothetical protein EVAR_14279_1 [Eumeta japonica]